MKLEPNKRYVTRDGQITSPLTYNNGRQHPYQGAIGDHTFSWRPDGSWLAASREGSLDLLYLVTDETTNEIATESGRRYVIEEDSVYMIEPDGSRILVWRDMGGCPSPKLDADQLARLTIAATLGAGLLGKLNYTINADRTDLFAKDALALADALIQAAKTPPTP